MVKSWNEGRGRKAQAVKSPLGGVWVRAGPGGPGRAGAMGTRSRVGLATPTERPVVTAS